MILYEIINLVNGNRYYGQTTRKRLLDRWREHLYPLRKGKHPNRYLQFAWDKYGEKSFKCELIKEFNTIEELNEAEIGMIEDHSNTYNLAKGGNAFQHKIEAKEAIGKSNKKPIIGMSIKTGEIKEYSSILDAGLDGFNHKNIGKCCRLSISYASGRMQQALSTGKWVWMYKDDFNIEEMNRRANMARNRGKNDQSRAIIGKSLIDGSIIEFRSCTEASNALNVHSTHIRGACLGKEHKSAAQHVWVFTDEVEPTILLDKRYRYAMDTFNGHKVIGPRSKHSTLKKV